MALNDLARHPPGWLVLGAVSLTMAVSTWPARLSPGALLQRLQVHAQTSAQTPAPVLPFTHTLAAPHRSGGFDPYSRGTGTALPVLATVVAQTPTPPGPSQVVRCRAARGMVFADSWSACPRGVGELVSVMR